VTKRQRADNPRVWGPCEKCPAPGIDRHHRDGNPGNNVPENLMVLCRRCHMVEDGRLAALRRKVKP
jgi:5-methylcytosine-specific restriction endonuclease McrA